MQTNLEYPSLPRRFAIYTRRSVEETSDTELGSIEAQREVCAAYGRCQAHAGWTISRERYDDNGYSGGDTERPGLQRLLDDVRRHRVDGILVYKIDRLTRSLFDFVKLNEELGVPLISVTQAFDTGSSMGRLVLNILLTFAQFEREMLTDRIKDKLECMRDKGLYPPAVPPLGYDKVDGRLVVNETEAATIKSVFESFLSAPTMNRLYKDFDAVGLRTKVHVFPSGRVFGGVRFTSASFYKMLRNPLYCGLREVGDKLVTSAFPAIISQDLWRAVQSKHAERAAGRLRPDPTRYLLRDLIFDDNDRPMKADTNNSSSKATRYYQTDARHLKRGRSKKRCRVRAVEVEEFVLHMAKHAKELRDLPQLPADDHRAHQREWLVRHVRKITVSESEIRLALAGAKAETVVSATVALQQPSNRVDTGEPPKGVPNIKLVNLLKRAERARRAIADNPAGDLRPLANTLKSRPTTLHRLARLAYLAPDIQSAIFAGSQPPNLTAEMLYRTVIPTDWALQRRVLGFHERQIG